MTVLGNVPAAAHRPDQTGPPPGTFSPAALTVPSALLTPARHADSAPRGVRHPLGLS